MRFNVKIPQINPKALIPDTNKLREKIAGTSARATEAVTTASDFATGEEEISSRISDLQVMVDEAPGRVFDAYLINIDAALYTGTELMPELKTVIKAITHLSRPIRFMSWLSAVTPARLVEIMAGEGIEISADQVITPATLASRYLTHAYPGAKVFVAGETNFRDELAASGIAISDDPSEINVVMLSFAHDFSMQMFSTAYHAIADNGADLVTSSLRRLRRLPDGTLEPGVLPLVTALETATRKRLTKNLGSPETDLLEMIFEDIDVSAEEALFVTDSLGADIRMAKRFGVPTALVLTGDTSLEQTAALKPQDQPNYVLASIADIIPNYIKDQL
ncbi:HAD-IIA family hydrolase [Trueperella pecoris]|uniref:HAD-IIA family hydrolase n=1 Tax=Trueperella pecoris TaxID=2733571 RepID=UPI00186BABC5|nr:HAD hydrolase-like protein [Trueperella pecoris]QOQ39336.1 HAD hydrolase-like protein [Trueperella pecoris]